MGFELRSSRAITIENKTQLIAQPPPLSEQSLALREDASSEYAPTASPPLSKGGFRRDCKYQGGRSPSLSLRKGVCREALLTVEREELATALRSVTPIPTLPRASLQTCNTSCVAQPKRGIGYCATLRDADPCLATGLPANLQHELRGSLSHLFLFVGLFFRASPRTPTNKKRLQLLAEATQLVVAPLRRERDSNPRTREGQRFSRPPQSTTLPSLRVHKNTTLFLFCQIFAPKRVKTATQIEQPLLPKGPIVPNNSYRRSSESSVP